VTARVPVIALSSGEPAGVGPELCARLAAESLPARIVILGDAGLLAQRGRAAGIEGVLPAYLRGAARPAGAEIEHIPLVTPSVAGTPDPANARYVLALLDRAVDGCLSGEFDAMVTAPVHKGVINDAGIAFTGHTEYLAARTRSPQVVMMLVGGGLRVALATTHLALADVPRAITRPGLRQVLGVIDRDLRTRFGIARPRILVASLNPHGGESGHLGREEIETIAPALAEARAAGMRVEGPLPADTLFVPQRLEGADCALAMYHDQGLTVLKYASFGRGVNVTLGLPFVRTSVGDCAGAPRGARGVNPHRPRKRFGQHFLHDAGVVARLVAAIRPAPDDPIVEIGPGEGALTTPLLEHVRRLEVIEIDRDLAARLRAAYPAERLVVHEADFARLPPGLRIVGNLPYNVSTPLLFHLAAFVDRVRDLHFMLQREVVERMVARPSTPAYGRLSVMLQTRFRLEMLFRVAPGAFRPPPKVESAVVRLVPLATAARAAVDFALLSTLVAGAFSARRKKLSNALPLEAAGFEALALDPNLRPENLSPDDYVRVARFIADRA
jgi:4-hydroxythreonine-4-phosphate dehydrogenase